MNSKEKLQKNVKKNLVFGAVLFGVWVLLSTLDLFDIRMYFLSPAQCILFIKTYWFIIIPLIFICFNCIFCFNPYRLYREKSRLLGVKMHFYIATNLYLLLLFFVQVIIVPMYKKLYDNSLAELLLPTQWLLFFSDYWYIFAPLMFIAGNWLVNFVCIKKKNILERPFSFFYGILTIVSFISFFVISIPLYLPLFNMGPMIK